MVRYAALLAFALCACTPSLDENGAFLCEDGTDAECPPGFTCRSDARCYGPDAPGFTAYTACREDAECAAGEGCYKIDDAAWGQCSPSCTTSADCPDGGACEVFGGGGRCVGVCTDDDDCPEALECLVVPMTMGVRGCHGSPTGWLSVITCTLPMGQCPVGMACARSAARGGDGVCSYPCGNPQEACPGERDTQGFSECATLGSVTDATPTDAGCLRPCTEDEQCQNPAVTCAFIAGNSTRKYCIPPTWQ